jgi:hypothetical protein
LLVFLPEGFPKRNAVSNGGVVRELRELCGGEVIDQYSGDTRRRAVRTPPRVNWQRVK